MPRPTNLGLAAHVHVDARNHLQRCSGRRVLFEDHGSLLENVIAGLTRNPRHDPSLSLRARPAIHVTMAEASAGAAWIPGQARDDKSALL